MIRKVLIASVAAIVLCSTAALGGGAPGWNQAEPVDVPTNDEKTVYISVTSDIDSDRQEYAVLSITGELSNHASIENDGRVPVSPEEPTQVGITIQGDDIERGTTVDGAIQQQHELETETAEDTSSIGVSYSYPLTVKGSAPIEGPLRGASGMALSILIVLILIGAIGRYLGLFEDSKLPFADRLN
jgi:hypothetical protein